MQIFAATLALAVSTQRLSTFDLALVGLYLAGITLFGLRFRKKSGGAAADRSLKSYFLADNTIPWWAIALSIVSAETSTLTIISIPGVAFAGDFGFLQVVIGYMLGRVVVAGLFLPKYFAGEMLTAYQLIDRRFGAGLHKVTAALFLLTRAAAEGVRVFAVSIVVGIAIGTKDVLSIAIISALTLLYTFEGGMAAVVWTDVVQMAIYLGGTVVAILTLGSHVQGGWSAIHAVAGAAGKFHVLNFALNLTTAYTFWAGVLGGTFLTMASHGTDQLMVQRMLAARNLKESRLALLSSGVVIFVQFALFLLIGAGLYVFYGQHPATFASGDRIFPTFIVREMPIGVAGILVAAILAAAMSNLSAALNSLSSTTVVDFYMRWRPKAEERERTMVSKSSTLMWALVLFAIAVYSVGAGGKGHVVEIGLSIASVAYGCLLGVFLLGTLTKFASEMGASVGMVVGFVLNVWLWQGRFPVQVGPVTIPHIAWTWYVLIGAAVTFGVGMLASVVFRQGPRKVVAAAALMVVGCSATKMLGQAATLAEAPDFSQVNTLIDGGVGEHRLPGAVLVIGHGGQVVYEKAYGSRELMGEPGLDGVPLTQPEAMTEDTIFDMASLSKDLGTATSVMELVEQGKIGVDDPIAKYFPAFVNEAPADPRRALVTVRMLLTHTSGEAPDVVLKDPWGLAAPDKAEGIHRALVTPLKSGPGEVFRYSDINFILLGALVEKVSGLPLDVYARKYVFEPLGMMDTRYLPIDQACGNAAAFPPYSKAASANVPCDQVDSWDAGKLLPRIAPEAHDDEGNAQTNPNFNHLLRGTVHDPTTRRMGGVAGHAGVFSTAHDVSLYAQALLDRLAGRPSNFPLKQSTLELMTTPEQPGHEVDQLTKANAAEKEEIAAGEKASAPLLAPSYPAIKGQDLRGFGWDIDTAFSKPRGLLFPIGSFGHTGFTGTSLWMDPGSDTYIVLLANAIHPRGNPPISNLRGQVATATAEALHLYSAATLTGIDVLEKTNFAAIAELATKHEGEIRIGLLTNQSGVDSTGNRTIDVLAKNALLSEKNIHLTTLFSPEHGILGKQDSTKMNAEVDPATGIKVTGLYGAGVESRKPQHEQLKDLDAVVIDLQDVGVRFYTYETVVGYFVQAAAKEKTEFHHALEIIVLDRPDMLNGEAVEGPVSDEGRMAYINLMREPVRLGMTLGELAKYVAGTQKLDADVKVVAMENWTRGEYFDETGLRWINPSPNLHSMTATVIYPGLGLFDPTNLSVGRGTATPFEVFGAGVPAKDKTTGEQKPAWFKAAEVAAALNARAIAGVSFSATKTEVAEDSDHYPYHGQTIEAVRVNLLDRKVLDSPEMGLEITSVLHRLYPTQFLLDKMTPYIANAVTLDAVKRGDDARTIAAGWESELAKFREVRKDYLIYPEVTQ